MGKIEFQNGQKAGNPPLNTDIFFRIHSWFKPSPDSHGTVFFFFSSLPSAPPSSYLGWETLSVVISLGNKLLFMGT